MAHARNEIVFQECDSFDGDFRAWLKNVRIQPPLEGKNHIIEVASTDSIFFTFETLFKNHILSVPVYDPEKHSYIGNVDMLDIVAYALEMFNKAEVSAHTMASLSDAPSFRLAVTHLANLSKRNPLRTVTWGTDMLTIMTELGVNGIHRVAVVDPESKKVEAVLSQSTALAWLSKHADKAGAVMGSTLAELNLVTGGDLVVTVQASDPAHEAFKVLTAAGVSAAAVVNAEGKIVTILSATDIKAVQARDVPGVPRLVSLYDTTLDFVAVSRQMSIETFYPTISCAPEQHLRDVVARMVATRMHRMFIVSPEHRPVGIVALKDILTLALRGGAAAETHK